MHKSILLSLCLMVSPWCNGALLMTANYVVHVTQNCAEGNVTCDDVTYIGQSKKSGRSITLTGHTLHRMCADGVTPCEFLGYEFKNGHVTYSVLASGMLCVKQDGRLILHEQGTWRY